jgi:hypothetical protein
MGNESLPPPPPPGEPPHVPPTPPVPPPPPGQFPPTPPQPPVPPQYPPTQQVPPTQSFPAQPYPQPAPGYAPGYGQPPATPKKSKNGLYILAAVVAIGAIVAGVLVFGGKDNKTETLGGDDTSKPTLEATTTAAVDTTTATTDGGLVITAPATTEPVATTAPVGESSVPGDVQKVADSTGTFTAYLPTAFNTNTDPITSNGISFSHISGSANLDKYVNDNDTFGITLLTANTSDVASPADLVNNLDPGQSVCTTRVADNARATTQGTASLLELDGCGTGGASAKIILVVEVAGSGKTLIAVAQGPGPASGDLLTFTQAVFETVVYG